MFGAAIVEMRCERVVVICDQKIGSTIFVEITDTIKVATDKLITGAGGE